MGKILITGLSGFIGSNLLDFLKENHATSLDRIIALSSVKQEGIETIIYKHNALLEGIVLPDCDTLIHLGAWIPKISNDGNNVNCSNSNIFFTAELLNLLPSSIKNIIFISTVDVYGEQNEVITENTMTTPTSLYGSSKLYCETMVANWAKEREIGCQILRIGHIYGKGEDQYKKLIPIFINNILNNVPISISSSGAEKRSFLHVSDCVRCIWEAIQIPTKTNIINIVSEHPKSVKEIAELLVEISGTNETINILNQNIKTRDLVFNNTLMKSFFGEEKVKIEDGLKEEFNYFQEKI